MPDIINHAGEEAEAGRDVTWEQQDTQGLQRNTHRNGNQREKDVIPKETNTALPCYLYPVAAD